MQARLGHRLARLPRLVVCAHDNDTVDTAHPADKQSLRDRLTEARGARSTEQINLARARIRSVVLDRHAEQGWSCVCGYLPLRTEPGSVELLRELADRGVRVLVPVLLADRDLDWAEWDEQPGAALGLGAIADADAVLAPALAVAADGTRLGRGGGSYDRALARVRTSVQVAALVFDEELVDALPTDPWDVRVSAVITPSGWRDVTNPATG